MRSERRRHGLAVAGVALATPADTSPSLSNRGAQYGGNFHKNLCKTA
ncbi:TPA: conjugal transfer protein [Clostridioides difficile]|nr:conjugal transfer protein [Clostridioides difficile]EGT3808770.1 conjugal transfer protein [Clostridioides difficile]EGT3863830.1 conjugal transfer protein [Clostridioides difficile]EGT4770542.1 conjugal transfer protein [Clostridioides difficile]EGT4998706.1 conjugal transfer protein [Clostridioides difficile]